MITYTWQPAGQLFLIREGKNFIGAGRVSSDASHRICDILIANDAKLSAEHALILCRHGRYDIVDQESSNGTFLSGELVPLQGIELPNYAEIQTGSTVWTFIKITPAESEKALPSVRRGGQEARPGDAVSDKPEKPNKPPTEIG
jgi:pSer/pThr/pTyr-binding forkhead associated (FHA) protein